MDEQMATFTDERTSEFLNAEEMAKRLTSSLARLEQEANHYASSKTCLEDVAKATQNLVVAVRVVGDDAAKALDIVASVGGPKIVELLSTIVDRTSNIESQIASQSSALQKRIVAAVYLAGAAAAFAIGASVLPLIK